MRGIPLYQSIIDDIVADIKLCKYRAGDRIPSQHSLMEKYNVSRVTVINALSRLENDGYITVKKGSGSFVADLSNTKVTRQQRRTIGVVIPFLRADNVEVDHMDYLCGINKCLHSSDCMIAIYSNTNTNESDEVQLLQRALNDECDGILFYPEDTDSYPLLIKLASNKFPIVVIDKTLQSLDITSVSTDNFKASFNAVNYLLDKGYKNIGYITNTGIYDTESIRERYRGYCTALSMREIPQDFLLTQVAYQTYSACNRIEPDMNECKVKIKQSIDTVISRGCNAVVTHSDYYAREILTCCKEMGISVPESLAIIGFDDLKFCSYTSPSITSIKQDFFEIGFRAAQCVLKLINNNNLKREKILIEGKLIERQTT